MKKFIFVLLLLAFAEPVLAVGGRQVMAATVHSSQNASLSICFETTDWGMGQYCAKAKNKATHSVSHIASSHKTYEWYLITANDGLSKLDRSCQLLGFSLRQTQGKWQLYYAKRKTAHSHYKFDFAIEPNGNSKATVYCQERAWD